MSFIECTLIECGDGTCLNKCVQGCGGEKSDVANFACSAAGLTCTCLVADSGVPLWVYVVAGVTIGLLLAAIAVKLCRNRQQRNYQTV